MNTSITRLPGAAIAITIILLGASQTSIAKEMSKVDSSMHNTGIDDDAAATIKSSFRKKKSTFKISCTGLEDGKEYRLMIDGVQKAGFIPDSGNATLNFNNGKKRKKKGKKKGLFLDFDPRGSQISIEDDSGKILETKFNSEGDPDGTLVNEITALTPTVLAPGGEGSARYQSTGERSTFKVEIEDIPEGDYDLYIDGIHRGFISVESGKKGTTKGEIEFDSQPDSMKQPLEFDPRNKSIDIIRNAETYFTDLMIAQIKNVNSCIFSKTSMQLESTGTDADASAELEFDTKENCVRGFKVEVEDLPVGEYELIVDGNVRGVLSMTNSLSGTNGELEFSSDPHESGKQLLNFEPKGKIVQIQQGTTIYFNGDARNSVQAPSVCAVINDEVALINSGVSSSAKGKSRFRQDSDCDQDFRVEIEDLPAGNYQLFVSGINRGEIMVSLINGEFEGQIEFDTDPDDPGEVLLDFDPRNQLIEIRQGGTVFLSRTFPN